MSRDVSTDVLERLHVSRESRERLETYVSLLLQWQARINLIGPATREAVWTRHIADALQLLSLLPPDLRKLADLGSGAGIPGLILAIARPLEAHLFESNLKKGAFLREAARQTGAKAHIHTIRIEEAQALARTIKAEAVTARALAPLPKLLDYAAPFLENGAIGYFHKGQDVDAELTDATKSWKMQVESHPSMTDSHGVILVVKEAHRVLC
ncbi:16S rRNA (guanine(527)-N(7))-methyltransferase RsmG [Taklimakanibacter deserti]|uniref:16S rRNA (guanine(527)-N(7))-methyltransferase RsmG n=1 Tax=Taklimakanibacter deserti TaxID=2267839 RepID=UPI000E655D2B